jgi:hypothetical protein
VPDLQKDRANLKNNILPFPVEHMPKDPPRVSGWHVLGMLVIIGGALGLLWLTISALIE